MKYTSSNFKYSFLPTRAISSGKEKRQGFGSDVVQLLLQRPSRVCLCDDYLWRLFIGGEQRDTRKEVET